MLNEIYTNKQKWKTKKDGIIIFIDYVNNKRKKEKQMEWKKNKRKYDVARERKNAEAMAVYRCIEFSSMLVAVARCI